MLSHEELYNIRNQYVVIHSYSDDFFIELMNRVFTNVDFITLAAMLWEAPLPYNFSWHQTDWLSFYDGEFLPLLAFQYEASTAWGPVSLYRDFVFENKDVLIANHIILKMPEELQGKGLSRRLNGALYKMYRSCGVRFIRAIATLDAGGYVWALAGFCATDAAQVKTIMESARTKAEDNVKEGKNSKLTPKLCDILQKRIDSYYTYNPGKHLPMRIFASVDCAEEILLKTEWSAELDLEDWSQYSIFEEYLNK